MSVPAPMLYSRGFLLSDSEETLLASLPHYTEKRIGTKVLYHDEIVPVDVHASHDSWLAIVGTVLETAPRTGDSPAGSIATRLWRSFRAGSLGALEGELYDLGGRYAVIASDERGTWAYHDAAGTRAIYYDIGNGNVGSHYDMLARLHAYQPTQPNNIETLRLDLRNRYTAHPEILSLLPNHRLDVPRAAQERFFLDRPNFARTQDFESKVEAVMGSWESQLTQALRQADDVGFSMTGGWDSRLLLALASGVTNSLASFTYTYTGAASGAPPRSKWDEAMKLDFDIVNRLRPFLPARHTFITKPETGQGTWRAAHISTLRRNSEGVHGQWLLADYIALFASRSSLYYRGNIVGLGRMIGAQPDALEDPHGRLRALVRNRASRKSDPHSLALGIHDQPVVREQYESVHPDYELTDVWYWENRLARWYAQLLNETDVAFDTFTPFNTRRIIDSFLSLHPIDRKEGVMQWELIYRGNPYLTFYGANTMDDLYRSRVSSGRARPW